MHGQMWHERFSCVPHNLRTGDAGVVHVGMVREIEMGVRRLGGE